MFLAKERTMAMGEVNWERPMVPEHCSSNSEAGPRASSGASATERTERSTLNAATPGRLVGLQSAAQTRDRAACSGGVPGTTGVTTSVSGWASILAAAVLAAGGCHREAAQAEPQVRPAAPVLVARAELRDVPVEIRNIGAVEAYRTAEIKARVGGQITKVHFAEGQDVEADQPLFDLDRRPFEAALAQAQAQLHRQQAELARDRASLEKADADVLRYRSLRASNTISDEIFQEYVLRQKTLAATVQAGQAAVEAAQAAVQSAELMLEYAQVRAPFAGRTGDLLVDEGNLVKADDAKALLVITQIEPIYVRFVAAEKYLSEIRARAAERSLSVRVLPPGGRPPVDGKLTFIDNMVDCATGTIALKATFDNHQRELWPGEFVEAVLTLDVIRNAVVVPAEAVQVGQQGTYVFVVDDQQKAQMKPVAVRLNVGNDAVISEGLSGGETVVVDGHMRLSPGAAVVVRQSNGGAESSSPPGRTAADLSDRLPASDR